MSSRFDYSVYSDAAVRSGPGFSCPHHRRGHFPYGRPCHLWAERVRRFAQSAVQPEHFVWLRCLRYALWQHSNSTQPADRAAGQYANKLEKSLVRYRWTRICLGSQLAHDGDSSFSHFNAFCSVPKRSSARFLELLITE